MASAYGAPWAVRSAPTGERPGSLYAAACLDGAASMLAESGGRGLLIEEAVVRHVRGVTNILRASGMLDGAAEPVTPPTVVRSFDWLRAPVEGSFHPRVAVGQMVSQGAAAGELLDLVGAKLAAGPLPAPGLV